MRAALLLLAACSSVDVVDGTWEPAESITGELAPEFGPAATHAPASTVRIGSFNIWLGSDPTQIARELGESPEMSKADVIVLQEVEHVDGEQSRVQIIGDALHMSWVYAPARRDPGKVHGIAILSRFPILNPRVMHLPSGHMSWHQPPRNALAAEIDFGTRVVTIVNVHLDTRIGPVDRVKQLHPVVTNIPDDVLVGGDYNTNPYAWVDNTVPLTSTQAIVGQDQATVIDDYMAEQGFDVPIAATESTYPIPVLAPIRLDEVYARGYGVIDHGVADDVEGSDHWPVWIDLDLR